MRRVGLDDLLLGADEQREQLLLSGFADAVMKSLDTNEIAALADGGVEGVAFPAMASIVEEMRQSFRQIGSV
ncbi:hypothetical protein D9M73_270780 [compost metagenome]